MKKRRGKQPVKPDLEEAMKERIVSLKGKQFSTMNLPMIYRRTFNWTGDSVLFKPVDRRSFVVMRPDTKDEELRTSEYAQKDLDLSDLPWYHEGRASSETNLPPDMEELKEMLIALSLNERYVDIHIDRPKDRGLDMKLRSDLEYLSRDQGFKFSLIDDRYICTFLFPKNDLAQMEVMSSELLVRSIRMMRDFANQVVDLEWKVAPERISDLLYSIKTIESSMDSLYTDSINLLWDPPQLEVPGLFLMIQAHEAANDELEAIAKDSLRFVSTLPTGNMDIRDLIWEEFVQVWRTSVLPSLDEYEALLKDGETGALKRIRGHRIWKESGTSPQNEYISNVARRIESLSSRGTKGVKLLASSECIKAMQALFSINDSASRLESISQVAATMKLYNSRSG